MLESELENMPKHKEYYEVSKEQAKYMRAMKVERDRCTAETDRIPSRAVDIEFRVGSIAAIGSLVERSDCLSATSDGATPTRGIYENLPYLQQQACTVNCDELGLSKSLILNKFFRSTERNYAAYENLCSGCGYGVFEARGRLCNFCQYVVHGGYTPHADSWQEDADANGNIYENICDKCAGIFSSEECDCCQIDEKSSLEAAKPSEVSVNVNVTSDEVVKCKPLKAKRDKKSLFHGLIGSLRRVKSSSTTPPQTPLHSPHGTRRRLEIVHNVEGFDNVFRTQESFDLDRICELKRSQNSNSDQHIYGRLKQRPVQESNSCTLPAALSQSQDRLQKPQFHSASPKQVVSADCLVSLETGSTPSFEEKPGKRPRISKPRLLRSRSVKKSGKSTINGKLTAPVKQSLYLVDNVCQWMTSLRREVHNYHSAGLVDDVAECDPKSIPAKHTLIYARISSGDAKHLTPASFTLDNNDSRQIETFCQKVGVGDRLSNCDDLEEDVTGSDDQFVTLRHANQAESWDRARSPVALTVEQRMVQDFMRNVMSKQMQQQREVSGEATTKASPTSGEQRSKRQAIYLKLHDQPHDSRESANNHIQHKVNCQSQEQSDATSKLASKSGLASRRVAADTVASARKRCGIHERDSEFVNDILNAFDQFLQRETDAGDRTSADAAANRRLESGYQLKSDVVLQQSAVAHRTPKHESAVRTIDNDSDRELIEVSSEPSNEHEPASESSLAHGVAQSVTVTARRGDHVDSVKIFNVSGLIYDLLLSRCLNSVVVSYDGRLSAFLRCLHNREVYREKFGRWTPPLRLLRKFHRFVTYCEVGIPQTHVSKPVCDSGEVGRELSSSGIASGSVAVGGASSTESEVENCVRREVKMKSVDGVQVESITNKQSHNKLQNRLKVNSKVIKNSKNPIDYQSNKDSHEVLKNQENYVTKSALNTSKLDSNRISDESRQKPIKPKVPLRDPSTCITAKNRISPPRPAKLQSQPPKDVVKSMMTKKSGNNSSNKEGEGEEEGIYQPIWKFKTVGEVQERYHTDADYYEFKDVRGSSKQVSKGNDLQGAAPTDVEDHGEWETDDEFMFTNLQLDSGTDSADAFSLNSSTVRSVHSGSSISGSTVTGYASTITIASGASSSLTHHLFRNVGIFYSLSEPKLRAIVYDYDRVYATAYFAKHTIAPSNGAGKPADERSPVPPPRTSSASQTKANLAAEKTTAKARLGLFPGSESDVNQCQSGEARSVPKRHILLPDSVQAWKFMLLDVNYVEDEEDVIVSESEILRAQEHKDVSDDVGRYQVTFTQRFKSASIGNLIDIPTDEEKKSIAERMRNKLQRGVFKLNVRSPKSEKKSRGIFRRAEATSLYLEDGMKPKYPIFGAPLDHLELNQSTQPNVPRFVIDCIRYIERQDCIQQDGLYRASGNKVSVDELKQKLSDSYIYDPKLLVCDDIHTLTSLLKLFFRELGAPLIPQETYERLGRTFNDDAAIEALRDAFDEMREPNRATLKFLIKHLTNVALHSSENRMPASNLAIVWGPCLLSANQIEYDIARMNTLAKVLIENHSRIFADDNERLVS